MSRTVGIFLHDDDRDIFTLLAVVHWSHPADLHEAMEAVARKYLESEGIKPYRFGIKPGVHVNVYRRYDDSRPLRFVCHNPGKTLNHVPQSSA